jgi:hypothetical protein
MKSRWPALLFTAAALLLARPLSAQILGGRVIDKASGEPVKDAVVEVLNAANSRVVARARSDGDGFVAFELREPGSYRVRTSRIGYTTNTSQALQIDVRQTVQVDIPLTTGEVTLDSLTVTARSAPARSAALDREGFYDREKQGFGRFLTEYDIQQRNAIQSTEIFRGVPGLTLVPAGNNSYRVVSSRGGNNCSPNLVLDNMPLSSADDLDDMVKPQDIAGVEVYRGASEIPGRWLGNRGNCGLIVIWTKRGEPNH